MCVCLIDRRSAHNEEAYPLRSTRCQWHHYNVYAKEEEHGQTT